MTLTEFTEFTMHFLSLSVCMGIVILLVRFGTLVFGRRLRALTRYLLWILILVWLPVPMLLPMPAVLEIPLGNVERYYHVIYEEDETFPMQVIPQSEYNTYVTEKQIETEPAGEDSVKPDSSSVKNVSVDLVLLLPVLWLTGAAVYLLWNLGGYLFVMFRFRRTFVPAPEALNRQAHTLGTVRGMKLVPAVYTSNTVRSPMLCGFFRPVIVVPRMELTENEAAGVLAHELTHYRRGDLWVQLFSLLVCTIHWFNPAVHLADRWMREEMELSCDEAVLDGQSEEVRSEYGNGMLTILRQCRKRSVPMTTHFSPSLRMMQARFENIMDTRQKKRGLLWIPAVLLLCITAGTVAGCVQEKVVETVSPTNLSFANVGYDSRGRLHRIDFGSKGRFYSSEDIEQTYPWIGTENYIPVFVNGSLLADRDGMPALPAKETEDGTYLVDVMAILLTMYSDTGRQVEGELSDIENGLWTAWFSYRIDGKVHEVEIQNNGARIQKTLVTLDGTAVDISFTLEQRADPDEGTGWHIWVTPEDAAMLLGAEYAFYNAGSYSYIGEDGKPMLYYPFGEPFYLSNEPHFAFWRYPESASVIPEQEALEKLETKLIQAYEAAFGTYVPLEEEPASSPYPGDEVMYRWKIAHLEVASETDRFYRIPFVWDFLVDKYTGEVITHYNGIDQSFNRFNAEFPAALAFAG